MNSFLFLTMQLKWKIWYFMNGRIWYIFQKQNKLESSKRNETQMTNKLAVRVFKQVSDETIMRSWGHKLLHYQIIICITSRTMSSDNSDNDNDGNDNYGVPTSSRDMLGERGLWTTMTTTLTAIDVKTNCPVRFKGWMRDKSKCAQKKGTWFRIWFKTVRSGE